MFNFFALLISACLLAFAAGMMIASQGVFFQRLIGKLVIGLIAAAAITVIVFSVLGWSIADGIICALAAWFSGSFGAGVMHVKINKTFE